MQPLQRSYAITEERVDQMLADGTLNSVYDPAKVDELEEQGSQISVKDKMKLDKLYEQKPVYEAIISALPLRMKSIFPRKRLCRYCARHWQK